MDEERNESKHGSNIKLYIGIIIGLGIGYLIGIKGYIRLEKDVSTSKTTTTEKTISSTSTPTPTTTSTSAAKKTTNTPTKKLGTDPDAVTIISYSQDWLDSYAKISFKNNTETDITSITGRMIYYDMNGTMLDYQDFTKKIDIAAGMTKLCELKGYNHDENYAYYESETSYTHPNNKYKIEFQLKSYQFK